MPLTPAEKTFLSAYLYDVGGGGFTGPAKVRLESLGIHSAQEIPNLVNAWIKETTEEGRETAALGDPYDKFPFCPWTSTSAIRDRDQSLKLELGLGTSMSTTFTENEIMYLTAWAIEDHKGQFNAPARTLQRQNNVCPAVLGSLVAHLAIAQKRSEMVMVEGPYPKGVITWPWAIREAFESRLKELLPESNIRYLEEIGALKPERAYS